MAEERNKRESVLEKYIGKVMGFSSRDIIFNGILSSYDNQVLEFKKVVISNEGVWKRNTLLDGETGINIFPYSSITMLYPTPAPSGEFEKMYYSLPKMNL